MTATLPVKKQDAYVVGPGDPPGPDIDSGMQRSTCNGAIGIDVSPAGVTITGANIGGDIQTDYHLSIANDQPPP